MSSSKTNNQKASHNPAEGSTASAPTVDEPPYQRERLAAEVQTTLVAVGLYLGVEPPGDSIEAWIDYAKRIRQSLGNSGESSLERLHRRAKYIAKVEESWQGAHEEERTAKSKFLEALIVAVRPALSAISEPVIWTRVKVEPSGESRTHHPDYRGIVVVDGWIRDARPTMEGTDAGRSLVVLEDGSMILLHHLCHNVFCHEESTTNSTLVTTRADAVSPDAALEALGRSAFLEIVGKLVGTVHDLARSPKRKEQTRESLDMADKLSALRVLLEGAR
jgi:hypothetical protein